MPITTIPVMLNISVDLPEHFGFALAPPRAADPRAWQYTAACGAATLDDVEFGPRVVTETAELATVPDQTDSASDWKDALIARLREANEQLEDDLTQAYEELASARAVLEAAVQSASGSIDVESTAAAEVADSAATCVTDDGAVLPDEPSSPYLNASTFIDDDRPPRACAGDAEVGDVTVDGVKISPKQRRAAQLLAGGAKIADVARAVGVERNTVQTWKRENAGFQAVLNSYSNDLHEAAQARLVALADSAVNVLATQVLQGNLAASLQLMKGIGMLTGKPRERALERADQMPCNGM